MLKYTHLKIKDTHQKNNCQKDIWRELEINGGQQKSQRQAHVQPWWQQLYQVPVPTTNKSVVQIQS